MKVWRSKNIFSLGEISPNLYHRFDLVQYEAGLRVLKNGFSKVEGTVTNCPELEIKQSNIVTTGDTIKTFLYNVDDRNNYKGILVLIDGNTFKLLKINNDNTMEFKKEFSAVYTSEEIKLLSIVQLENNIMICCRGKKPNLIRIDETNIGNSAIVNYWEAIVDPPVKPIKTEYQNKPTKPDIAQWNKTRFGNIVTVKVTDTHPIFSDTFLTNVTNGQMSLFGNMYRITSATQSGNETTFKLIGIDETGITPPRVDQDGKEVWETFDVNKISFLESIFSNNRYPALCSYYQGRLVFANVQDNPDFVAFSKTGDYFKFSGNVKEDDSGFTLAIPSDERAIINNIISWNSLLITTNIGVWSTPIMQGLTPTNSFLSRQLIPNFARLEENCINSNGTLYYVNDFKNKVYSLLYNYDSKMYQAEEISTYSNYMLKNGIRKIVRLQYDGEDYVACDMGDYYAMCTINRQQQVTSWNRYTTSESYVIINIEDLTLFLTKTNNYVTSKQFSYTVFKDDMEIQLLPPVLGDEATRIGGCPYIVKSSYSYGNIRVAVIGDYIIDINGQQKVAGLGHNIDLPYVVQFDLCNAGSIFGDVKPLTIKNKSNKKIEISGIYYTIESEEEKI